MTDSPKRTTSSRALILLLALGLVVMLASSLKERFESPGLTEQRRPGPAAQAGRQDDDAQQIGKLMRQIAENPNDSTAIIYQLVSAAPGHEKTNFVAEGDSALTMVGKDFKKAISKLNYTLKKKL